MMKTSAKGVAFIEAHEGVVLKAYRDAVGVWTIGAGLTAASGVVKPKAGMTITRAQASMLLGEALKVNYEPRVLAKLPTNRQCAFDGGVSFDFNTGAIHKASWVKAFLRGDDKRTRSGLAAWRKGGGKVLPGLVRRRQEEADIILLNRYPSNLRVASEPATPTVARAAIVISLSAEEVEAVRDGFRTLGYDPGSLAGAVRFEAVTTFQERYDLAVDGKIGRATLSTLQRELDARRGAIEGGGGIVAGGGAAAGVEATAPIVPPDAHVVDPTLVTWAATGVAILSTIYLLYLAWHYRDLVAARVQTVAPRAASWLRSF